MSNELESDASGAMVMNLESFGVNGAGYDETETEPPSSTNQTESTSDSDLEYFQLVVLCRLSFL